MTKKPGQKIAWGFGGILLLYVAILASGTGAMTGEAPYGHMLRFVLLSASGLLLLLLFPRKGFNPSRLVLLVAVLARMAILPMEHTDDMNRYLWEGKLVTHAINPYLHAPDDPSLMALAANDPYHDKINLPHLPAAYPPFVLGIFAGLGALWYNPWSIKLAVVAFDLASVLLILELLRFRRLNVRWALLYAVNPVVLYAFAGEGHFDSIQGFFLLASLVAFDRRRWGWMFLLAGLAIQSKYVAIVACPFLLRRDNLKWMWVGAIAVVIPFLPFLAMEPGNIFSCLSTFGQHYAYNGSIHTLLWKALDNQVFASQLCLRALALGLIGIFLLYSPLVRRRFRDDPITGIVAALSLVLVLSPTIHFWYLSWIVILLPLRPLRSWLLICCTISASFVTRQLYEQTGQWTLPNAFLLAEWAPLLILFWEAMVGLRSSFLPAFLPPKSISVVIPTLNEEERITSCIQSFATCPELAEVLVIDSGSADKTVRKAHDSGAKVLVAKGGRGGQILAGIKRAKADVVVIVHADTHVPALLLSKILEVLHRNPTIGGGAIGAVFDGHAGPLRLIEHLNNFRAAFLGISFGDQVQFFRRTPGLSQQIIQDIPLMEDVEFSLRQSRIGRRIFLFGNARVSPRKWGTNRFSRAILVIRLTVDYLWLRIWGKADADTLYRRYYNVTETKKHEHK